MEDDLWIEWERIIDENRIVIDRPRDTAHPRFPDMIYPVDYGYLEQTIGGDSAEIDIFIGSAHSGLVGLLSTRDAAKDDRETKLLWNLTDEEIETIVSFLNRGAMTASLIRRSDELSSFWESSFAFMRLVEVPNDFMSDRPLNVVSEQGGVFDDR